MPKNCALYARVSSSEQIKGYSIEAQLEAGRGHAAANGWTVAGEYIDAGLSGKTDERPQFKRMIKEALSGRIQIIIVHAFDRFSRNLEDAVVYKSLLRRDGVQVVSVTEQIDDGPLGFIHEGIIDLFAAYYSLNLSVKIRGGLIKAVESGRWPWSVPLGYHKKNGLVKISEAGAGVQAAFAEFATGNYTLESWAEAAYQAGLRGPNNNRIYPGGWSRMFHNRFYIGRLTWNELDVDGAHEALVDEQTFRRVQKILQVHDQFSGQRQHGFYLLSGLLYSLDAGCIMAGAVSKGRSSRRYRYYRSQQPGPGRHYIRAELLEMQVEEMLSQMTILPDDVSRVDTDESMRLALRVAPNMSAIYQQLDSDDQRRAFLRLIISSYGFKISGEKIVDIEPNSPFCFWLDLNSVEIAGVVTPLFFMIGVGA